MCSTHSTLELKTRQTDRRQKRLLVYVYTGFITVAILPRAMAGDCETFEVQVNTNGGRCPD